MDRKLIKKLDSLWALTVKEKAKYKCEHCGKYDSRMEAAHVVGRRHRATRWGSWLGTERYDLCGHCLCHVCHQQYDEHGPGEHFIVKETIGEERLEEIQFEAENKVAKWQEFEVIEAIIEKERAAADDSPFSGE